MRCQHLTYVKYLHTWLVVNHDSEPISWTDDAVDVAWLAEWVSGKCSNAKSETKSVAAKIVKRQRKLPSDAASASRLHPRHT